VQSKVAPALEAFVPALTTRERRALSRTGAARLVRGGDKVADTSVSLFIDLSSTLAYRARTQRLLLLLDPTISGVSLYSYSYAI
jgi:hypothetical protein